MQKILFKVTRQQINSGRKPSYNFVPYKHGCFSFLASKDLNVMHDFYGLISATDAKDWAINPSSAKDTDKDYRYSDRLIDADREAIRTVLAELDISDSDSLIHELYNNFPYFAIKSECKGIPVGIKRKIILEREQVQARNEECLFSIGYEGRCIDEYLNLLIENNIAMLCDVRRNPVSMKYGFSKKQLLDKCSRLGINYLHIPELGIASNSRADLSDADSYNKLFHKYRASLKDKSDSLENVLQELKNHKRIALTCYEADHNFCHRSSITNLLSKNDSIQIHHL